MAGRRIPPALEGRAIQAPGMMRHGPLPMLGPGGHHPLEPHPSELAANKLAIQVEEIERLAGENQRLVAAHVALRDDLAASQEEIQKIRAHIRSIQTESDIQIRVLLEKIGKMEGDIRVGESVRKDLQQAHMEAQSLMAARQELTARVQEATQGLQRAHAAAKQLPEMHAELDSLKQELQKLRATFEHEKGKNLEQVVEMQAMEKNLFDMAREMEKMRAEVLHAENRAHTPNSYGGPYMNPDPANPHTAPPQPSMQGGGPYADPYGRPFGMPPEGMYSFSVGPVPPVPVPFPVPLGGPVPGPGANVAWGAPYSK
ncbi:hypothetical protein RJ641_025397 [Dillenia turbinata]|uniref:Protein FLX-like 4 n=1 Tax=Dillenia turbinata TaxID=194707 RepID=A0AAN8ZSZ2_9MAGN